MKKITFLLTIVVLAIGLMDCQDVAAVLPSFDITKDITKEMPVAVTANADGTCLDYTETTTFDLKSNTQISENFSRVQRITVNSITWEVIDYVGDDGVFINGGLLKVGGTSFQIEEIDLKAADTANDKFIITDATKLAAIATELRTTGAITITLETSTAGNCENDFSYTLKITANVKVTVQP